MVIMTGTTMGDIEIPTMSREIGEGTGTQTASRPATGGDSAQMMETMGEVRLTGEEDQIGMMEVTADVLLGAGEDQIGMMEVTTQGTGLDTKGQMTEGETSDEIQIETRDERGRMKTISPRSTRLSPPRIAEQIRLKSEIETRGWRQENKRLESEGTEG
jgi:hypothetical protein